jgi:ANTH domain
MQASLLMVVKEGLGLYKVISEGIINVSDKFFDMEYLDAVKGLEIYKQAVLDFGSLQVGLVCRYTRRLRCTTA